MNKRLLFGILYLLIMLAGISGYTKDWIMKNAIEELYNEVKDLKGSIEDVNTKISNIDPLSSLISQGEEYGPGHHTFQHIRNGDNETGVVLELNTLDLEVLFKGEK